MGARPFFLDAEEHDAYAAAISHVPLVTSIALFNLARKSTAWPELANMAGPAFRDLTRLASGEPEMAHDIFLTNRDNVLHWLRPLHRRAAAAGGPDRDRAEEEALFRALAEAQIEREQLPRAPPEREDSRWVVEMPSASDAFMTMMTGRCGRTRQAGARGDRGADEAEGARGVAAPPRRWTMTRASE